VPQDRCVHRALRPIEGHTFRAVFKAVYPGAVVCPAAPLHKGLMCLAGLLVNGDFNAGDFSGWWTWAADPDNQSGAIEPVSGYSYDGSPNARLFSASSARR
jgi:hypothetical protein